MASLGRLWRSASAGFVLVVSGWARNPRRPPGPWFRAGMLSWTGPSRARTFGGVPLPERLEGCRLLRYEVQFKRRLKRQFKRTEPVTAELLFDRQFYGYLVDYWKREYSHILKKRPLVLMEPTGWRQLRNHLALLGTRASGGVEVIYEMLEAAKEEGTLERRQYYRLRQHVKKLSETEGLTTESEAAQELEREIAAAAERQIEPPENLTTP